MSLRYRDKNLNSEQQSVLDNLWSSYMSYGWTEAYATEMEGVYYSLWGKSKPSYTTPLPNSTPTPTTTVLPNSAPSPSPSPIPTTPPPAPPRPRDPKLTSGEQQVIDNLWNDPTKTEEYKNSMQQVYYAQWDKTNPSTTKPLKLINIFTATPKEVNSFMDEYTPTQTPLPNSTPNQLQQGMNALMQGKDLPVAPKEAPSFLNNWNGTGQTILEFIPETIGPVNPYATPTPTPLPNKPIDMNPNPPPEPDYSILLGAGVGALALVYFYSKK